MNQHELALGIELGSTRIKAVLIDAQHQTQASGAHHWQSQQQNGIWTYALADAMAGVAEAMQALRTDFAARHHEALATVGSIGISGMMHGYLALGKTGGLLVPFRTWQNTCTAEAAEQLSAHFAFNIPQRWSVAHYYQALLNHEAHAPQVARLTTLAGYVHHQLTGEHAVGVGEASGIFPVLGHEYHPAMLAQFNALAKPLGATQPLQSLLPSIRPAGACAGRLSAQGANWLGLPAGIPFCPPEGDAATGMVATNSILPDTGNVSVGTSVFAMLVLTKPLSQHYPEIDLVATPTGNPVAMVHCNNGTNELSQWVHLFHECLAAFGASPSESQLYSTLFGKSEEADPVAGNLLCYNYLAGESITHSNQGCPLLLRPPAGKLTLANLMRAQLFSTLATLRLGLNILTQREALQVQRLCGHGGFFATPHIGQRLLAAACNTQVTCLQGADLGGAWGMAVLARFAMQSSEPALPRYLQQIFATMPSTTCAPDPLLVADFQQYLRRFEAFLPVEHAAAQP